MTEQQLEAEIRREEQKKQQEEAEKRLVEEAERRKIEEEKRAEEERRRDEAFKRSLEEELNQQEKQVMDPYGNRWIRCEYCGKNAIETEFSAYGGAIGVHLNLGTCKECAANNPAANLSFYKLERARKKAYDPTVCPKCGERLVERNGRNGRFIGCTGFPRCNYTRSIR